MYTILLGRAHIMEKWKPITDFEGLYSISNTGRIKRTAKSRGSRPNKLLSPYPNKFGYLQVALRKDGKYHRRYVHRLILQAFTGILGEQCNHKNGIKTDNRLENLEWCTASENLMHASRTLGLRRGSKHWNAKLTGNDVISILDMNDKGMTHQAIADHYNVSRIQITNIVNRKAWKHITRA